MDHKYKLLSLLFDVPQLQLEGTHRDIDVIDDADTLPKEVTEDEEGVVGIDWEQSRRRIFEFLDSLDIQIPPPPLLRTTLFTSIDVDAAACNHSLLSLMPCHSCQYLDVNSQGTILIDIKRLHKLLVLFIQC